MSLFNAILVQTFIQGRFEFTITSSLFDALKLLFSLPLKCELTVLHLLFLDFNGTLLPCFLLDGVNNTIIYFTSVKYYHGPIDIKLKI